MTLSKENYTQTLIGSLSWYDDSLTRQALDKFWGDAVRYLQINGIDYVCAELQRNVEQNLLWLNPRLLVGQSCGPDLFTPYGRELRTIARPVFSDLDCRPGYYFSYIVSRTDRARRPLRVAVNSLSSRSGCLALMEWMDEYGLQVSSVTVSGSHKNSLDLLKDDLVDLAAIDAHTASQYDLRLGHLVIGRSREALTPPFVSHNDSGVDHDLLFSALSSAVCDSGELIGISDLIKCERCEYQGAD